MINWQQGCELYKGGVMSKTYQAKDIQRILNMKKWRYEYITSKVLNEFFLFGYDPEYKTRQRKNYTKPDLYLFAAADILLSGGLNVVNIDFFDINSAFVTGKRKYKFKRGAFSMEIDLESIRKNVIFHDLVGDD